MSHAHDDRQPTTGDNRASGAGENGGSRIGSRRQLAVPSRRLSRSVVSAVLDDTSDTSLAPQTIDARDREQRTASASRTDAPPPPAPSSVQRPLAPSRAPPKVPPRPRSTVVAQRRVDGVVDANNDDEESRRANASVVAERIQRFSGPVSSVTHAVVAVEEAIVTRGDASSQRDDTIASSDSSPNQRSLHSSASSSSSSQGVGNGTRLPPFRHERRTPSPGASVDSQAPQSSMSSEERAQWQRERIQMSRQLNDYRRKLSGFVNTASALVRECVSIDPSIVKEIVEQQLPNVVSREHYDRVKKEKRQLERQLDDIQVEMHDVRSKYIALVQQHQELLAAHHRCSCSSANEHVSSYESNNDHQVSSRPRRKSIQRTLSDHSSSYRLRQRDDDDDDDEISRLPADADNARQLPVHKSSATLGTYGRDSDNAHSSVSSNRLRAATIATPNGAFDGDDSDRLVGQSRSMIIARKHRAPINNDRVQSTALDNARQSSSEQEAPQGIVRRKSVGHYNGGGVSSAAAAAAAMKQSFSQRSATIHESSGSNRLQQVTRELDDRLLQRSSSSRATKLHSPANESARGASTSPRPPLPSARDRRFSKSSAPSDRLVNDLRVEQVACRTWRLDRSIKPNVSLLQHGSANGLMEKSVRAVETLRRIVLVQSVVRGRRARARYRIERNRSRIIDEIMTTERAYCESLRACVVKYYQPLSDSQDIDESTVRAIFSCIQTISMTNQSFYVDGLIASKAMPSSFGACHRQVGKAFLNFVKYMRCYETYVNNYGISMHNMAECVRRNKFYREAVLSAQQDCGQSLESLLIKPVQRIPRYVLLLRELVKTIRASRDEPDYEDVTSALESMMSLAERINEKKRQFERAERLNEIYKNTRARDTFMQEHFIAPHRCLVKEGELVHATSSSPTHDSRKSTEQTCYVVLCSDLLLVTTRRTSSSGNEQFTKIAHLVLSEKTSCQVTDERTGFTLEEPDTQASPAKFTFFTNNSDEQTQWVDSIVECTRSLSTSSATVRQH